MIIKLTEEQFIHAREEYYGYCTYCGAEQGQCEPNAREYKCEACGLFRVYGAEELLIAGKIEIVE